ncbi:hypothetical protein HMPREF1981_01197 [Bacteroides pyogenes F0041]|uniref:Uncharacterized protein n=1 Tax=Bacteroides pyogenes F0041 TaxID=1321819 RepID=U2C679_9BACE|nr:hypothetical protein HMPREF1981_01197 [Bacteroides pyogenes F0041]
MILKKKCDFICKRRFPIGFAGSTVAVQGNRILLAFDNLFLYLCHYKLKE